MQCCVECWMLKPILIIIIQFVVCGHKKPETSILLLWNMTNENAYKTYFYRTNWLIEYEVTLYYILYMFL